MSFERKSAMIAAVFAALGSTDALASTDNYVEIQIDSDVMSSIIRNRLAKNSDFCPQLITCPGGIDCVIDHLEVGPPGGWFRGFVDANVEINNFTTLQAPQIFYSQEFTAHLKTASCVEDPSCTSTIPYTATVVFEVYTNPNAEVCITDHSFFGLPPGVTPPSATVCLGLDLDHVLELTGQTSGQVSGRALSMDQSGSRLAMRVEYGRDQSAYGAARISAWQTFIDGALEAAGSADDWSMFVHQSLILAAFVERINSGLAGVSGFELTTGISASWISLGANGGQAMLHFDAVATDTDCPNDIGIEPVIISTMTGINAAHDGLKTDGTLAWNLDDGDVFWCGFVFGGFVGASILAVIADGIDIDLSTLGGSCSPTGDTSFTCNQKTHPLVISLGIGQSATFKLATVTGDAGGLAMNGDIALSGGSGALHTNVSIWKPFLGWNADNCYQGSCGYVGGLSVFGDAPICNIEFSADPLGIYEITEINGYSLPLHWPIEVSKDLDAATIEAYQDAPYGLTATVWTAAGVKTVEMNPVLFLEEWEEELLCGVEKIDYKLTHCMHYREWPWQKIYWGWYPDEWIDPVTEVAIEVLDPYARHLDFGIVKDIDVVVVRERDGLVSSVTVRAAVHAGIGNEELISQGLSVGVYVPPRTYIAGDAELIGYLLPDGYGATVELDRALVPPSVLGSSFALHITPAQLEHAAR